ncbi:MAG: helix-turn-helix domain-containing protein [Janthinobacterium svalbardensis]|uniref:HTH cro/C1-type domain-containing protein n=1 Tax=Janthinobacterium svalbardensis TaxID=368607 RepID=A0A290X058_9BURK|nr:helix-turn-helix transcriptional regulator [Janthinobacterium svalbardensis]ATD62521.1 hypothetical protein CNX70_22000 [Janthinobacterium svalbardensis]
MTSSTTSSTGKMQPGSLAEGIRAKRLCAGFSLADVAQRIGVSPQAVHKWECGTSTPRQKNHDALSGLLGMAGEPHGVTAGTAVDQIKAAGGRLGAAAALLSVIDILPVAERLATLETCAGLAADAARDLATFVGGAV